MRVIETKIIMLVKCLPTAINMIYRLMRDFSKYFPKDLEGRIYYHIQSTVSITRETE